MTAAFIAALAAEYQPEQEHSATCQARSFRAHDDGTVLYSTVIVIFCWCGCSLDCLSPGLQDPAEKPSSASSAPVEGENGAWRCPERGCRNVNWAYRASCNNCGRLRPGWGFRVTWLCTVQCGIISAVHFCATQG